MQLLATGVHNDFWLFHVQRVRDTLDNPSAWATTGPSGLNDSLKAYVKQFGESVLVPFTWRDKSASWRQFVPNQNLSVPWFERSNLVLNNWTDTGRTDGIGFLPNQIVDPGACAGSMKCANDKCAPLWPEALYAHHCINSWRGRIGEN